MIIIPGERSPHPPVEPEPVHPLPGQRTAIGGGCGRGDHSPRGGVLCLETIIYYLFIVAYLFTIVTYKNYSPRGGVLLTYGTCLHRL